MNVKWLDEEILLLKKLYVTNGLSMIELKPIFNKKYNRSDDSIRLKIKRLKLRHTKEQICEIKSRLNSGDKNGMFGKISAMKGLTKNNSKMMKEKSIKLSQTRKKMYEEGLLPDISGNKNPMFGKETWNKGLNKDNSSIVKKYGEKISIYKKKEWLNKTPEEKQKIIDKLNDSMIQNKKPTKIEIKMREFLKQEKIEFIQNYKIKNFLMDFYLPKYNLVIECDGDYWHANPDFVKDKELTEPQIRNIDRDKRKNKMLITEKIKFLRFWERDINNNFTSVEKKIKKSLV
jgi:very-short-patch-repair endonuclease